MKLSVVVPLHNEEENVDEVVKALLTALRKLDDYEVVLVNDCSTDSTGALVQQWVRKDPRVKVIHRRGQPGFGKALKEGFKAATGDVIIPFMGDLSDNPLDLIKLYLAVELD